MVYSIRITALLLLVLGLPFSGFGCADVTKEDEGEDGMFRRALWISQYDMAGVYLDGGRQRETYEYTKLCRQIVDNCVSLGFDTLIVQLRPNGDSIYPSELFPPSRYAVGAYGGEFEYDPFSPLLEAARERGLEVHGWINPFRLMTAAELGEVDGRYLIKKWWDDPKTRGRLAVEHGGRLYLNPAYPEVRELISDGAAEIMEKYALDGLHIDDYFYPHGIGADFDAEAYAELSGGLGLADWRRENVSETVKMLYGAVKSADPCALFGVSPGGNIDTAFNTDYADIYKWCGEAGYIDYICPQIYFGLEHGTWDFASTYEKWEAAVTCPDVELFVGMTLGKAVNGELGIADPYAGSGGREWIERKDVVKRCLELVRHEKRATGVAFFCYQYLFDPVSGEPNPALARELENFLPVWREME